MISTRAIRCPYCKAALNNDNYAGSLYLGNHTATCRYCRGGFEIIDDKTEKEKLDEDERDDFLAGLLRDLLSIPGAYYDDGEITVWE